MRKLLLPLAAVYQLILIIRHWLYDLGLLKSKTYTIPLIGVGNLSFGGTGKTPMVEHLVRLLGTAYTTAILSRGYKRKRKGAFLLDSSSSAYEAGDEARQYKLKFPHIQVAVAEKRVEGMKLLLDSINPPEVVVLDDVFQHRAIRPGLNILLTDYHKLYADDFLFPAGTLRDTVLAAKRADIIVVTKTPAVMSPYIWEEIMRSLKLKPHQKVFLSYLEFGDPYPIGKPDKPQPFKDFSSILLVTGIVNPYPLIEHARRKCNDLFHRAYPDHHAFSEKDLFEIRQAFQHIIGSNKIILTTEKDAARLADSPYFSRLESLPILVQPVQVAFHDSVYGNFDQTIIDYVRKASANS
ncbi:MAG: tetraacyldisaccharide 4'-kinase [Bacteroidetes bacterium]|nr:tetraacyldisaccharide 4'-kinase [Bacteroidota bacterium]